MNAFTSAPINEPSVAVVIASLGRPELARQAAALLEAQTSRPDMLLFSVASDAD